jgi:DNA-binding transcriptional LysR family regulator
MDRFTGLQIFARVVETSSFSKAARDLNLSQPTITRHVASLEAQLGARLLNRNTRGISLTEIGSLYYDKCKTILRELEEAESLVGLGRSQIEGTLRISTSVAFGRRVIAPLLIEFLEQNRGLRIDLTCEDTYVDLVAQGIDVALRMGRLADSSLGGRYLGSNPWVMVASPRYLSVHGAPNAPSELSTRDCLIYSSVQGDDIWHLRAPDGERHAVPVRGRLRSNNLSTILAAVRADLGLAILPRYVAAPSLQTGSIVQVMTAYGLQEQEIHAVFPSPKLVPPKVLSFITFLQGRFKGDWPVRLTVGEGAVSRQEASEPAYSDSE